MRKLTLLFAALLSVPAMGAAALVYAPVEQEQLVEGHTVFTVIEVRNGTREFREEFAAAVAVLVRETTETITYGERFPGVLWFNDQYLVDGVSPGSTSTFNDRYPCGAAIAVNAGDPLPTSGGVPVVPPSSQYVESYRITDPFDNQWEVDKWSYDPDEDPLTVNSFLIWSVPLGEGSLSAKSQAGYTQPDGGDNCAAASKTPCGNVGPAITDDTGPLGTRDPPYQDSGTPGRGPPYTPNGEGRRCIGNGEDVRTVDYNAVLFFFLEDLTDFAGLKDHAGPQAPVPSGTREDGCHVDSAWPCPGGDDNREGNSHRYASGPSWPRQLYEGRDNHGGSTGCGQGDLGGGAQYQHATCNVDIYYGYVARPPPPLRHYRVFDTEGGTAPYHCHTASFCNEEELPVDGL